MIEEHDERTTRCRKLGHPVPFAYCRQESEGAFCGSVLDCWWELFDVEGFLRSEAPEALAAVLARRPKAKVASLLELIEQAKRNAPRDS